MKTSMSRTIFLLLLLMLTVPLSVESTLYAAQPSTSKKDSEALIDINFATKQQLTTLPGIDDKLAQKIIDGRPYRTIRGLVINAVIPMAEFSKIQNRIIARHSSIPPASNRPSR